MEGIEFYTIENKVWFVTPDGKNECLDESKSDVVAYLIDRMMECYPETYQSLAKHYEKSALNVSYYRFLIAQRFCKCNFGTLDTTEFDCKGIFKFEKVSCPLRGECKLEGIVCQPKFNSQLSKKELEVMKLVNDGMSNEEIAERLYISPYTVKNHIRSVYIKLGIHEKSEFVRYANANNMFN